MSKASVTLKTLEGFRKDFLKDPKNIVAKNAVTRTDVHEVAMCRDAFSKVSHTFSEQVPLEGKSTNQRQTGRCWLFAGLNVMRLPLMKKYLSLIHI